jgi:hypothetical protein
MVCLGSISPSKPVFAIFTHTLCQGLVPAWYDDLNIPVTYPTEREAQREIAETLIIQLRQFLNGEREFDDALTSNDIILPVDLFPDGSIVTEDGKVFRRQDT